MKKLINACLMLLVVLSFNSITAKAYDQAPLPPSYPTEVKATRTTVDIKWEESLLADDYEVQHSFDGKNWRDIPNVDCTATITGLKPGTTTFARVRGKVLGEESGEILYSNWRQIEVVTLPAEEVKNVRGIDHGVKKFYITWDEIPGANIYRIEVNGNYYYMTDTKMKFGVEYIDPVNRYHDVYVTAGRQDSTGHSCAFSDQRTYARIPTKPSKTSIKFQSLTSDGKLYVKTSTDGDFTKKQIELWTTDKKSKKIATSKVGGNAIYVKHKYLKRNSNQLCKVRVRRVAEDHGRYIYGEWSDWKYVTNNVSDVRIKSSKDKHTLTWKKVKGATGYTVSYSTKKTGKYTKLQTSKKNSYKFSIGKKFKKGKTYYFKVVPYTTVKGKKVSVDVNTAYTKVRIKK